MTRRRLVDEVRAATAPVADAMPDDVRELRRVVHALRTDLARAKSGAAMLVDAVREVLEDPPNAAPIPPPPRSRQRREEVAVLHLTDLHVGQLTPFFSTEIAGERLETITRRALRIIDLRRTSARLDRLIVLLGGDVVHGNVVPTPQLHKADCDAGTQAMIAAPAILRRVLLTLLSAVQRVEVYCVSGNHGRVASSRKVPHGPSDSWDWAAYQVLQAMMLGAKGTDPYRIRSRLAFHIPDAWYALARIYDWGALLVHGDAVRGFAGMPWYGFGKKAAGWADVVPLIERAYGVDGRWDHLYAGHHHQHATITLNARKVYSTGSIVGYDAYAGEQLAAAGPGSQRLNVYDADHGVTAEYELHAENVVPQVRVHEPAARLATTPRNLGR